MACHPNTTDAEAAVEVADACMPILSKIGLVITDCLACGMEGCVYLLDSGDIAKVTARRSEPEFAATLLTLKNVSKHMPKIRGVWQLPLSCSANVNKSLLGGDLQNIPWDKTEYDFGENGAPIFYLVVREDLEDARGTVSPDIDKVSLELSLLLRDYLLERNSPNSIDKKEFNATVKLLRNRFEQDMADGTLYVDPDELDQIFALYKWLGNKQLLLGDLHLSNLGLRGNTIVARDLGFSTTDNPDRLYHVVKHATDYAPEGP